MKLAAKSQGSLGRKLVPIEELLGPARDRYFASGYRSVRYAFEAVNAANSQETQAVGNVVYPPLWSTRRDDKVVVPHLSSVDAVVLPLQLLEQVATRGEQHTLERSRVSAIDLRAGTKPWLALDAVPVRVATEAQGVARHVSAQVGTIRMRAELVGIRSTVGLNGQRPRPAAGSVYSGLFQSTQVQSFVRNLDTEAGVLDGSHQASLDGTHSNPAGIEAAYWPSLTIIDYLVTMGQLTQALVYAFAGTARSNAGPLWMRTMSIHIREQTQSLPTRFDTTTRILRDRVIDRGGKRIHDVMVESSSTSGVHARSTLAYEELPAS